MMISQALTLIHCHLWIKSSSEHATKHLSGSGFTLDLSGLSLSAVSLSP
jgi:hypothetical protein